MATLTFIIYDGGTDNPDGVVIEHSTAFPDRDLRLRDQGPDAMIFQRAGISVCTGKTSKCRWIIMAMAVALVLIAFFLEGCTPRETQSQGLSTPTPLSMKRLENARIGYSLSYPADWQVRGYILATAFARGAQCESVEVVDSQPPPGSGAASILHSFVQICARPLTDNLTLDDFMRQTYGNAFTTQFQVAPLAGIQAYRAINTNQETWFLQTKGYRIQIVASVVAAPDKQDARFSQVQQILASLSFH